MTKFSQELFDTICDRISTGESLRSVCKDETMPAQVTVFKWLANDAILAKQYARAREAQADAIFDEALDIADDSRNDWMENNDPENPGWRINGEHIQRARLRIDTRKWMAGKLRPKSYGDKLEIDNTSSDGSMSPVASQDAVLAAIARKHEKDG